MTVREAGDCAYCRRMAQARESDPARCVRRGRDRGRAGGAYEVAVFSIGAWSGRGSTTNFSP
jgi:hypothetical protein